MLTLAEPLMFNHFTVSARINITDPGNCKNGNCYTHIQGEESETSTAESGQTVRNQ